MLWIKRNLFLAVGGLVAAALLVYGIVFWISARATKSALDEEVNQLIQQLNTLANSPVSPSPTNIATAQRETLRLKGMVEQMQKVFTPVPFENVTGLQFRRYRDKTLADLHEMAGAARTTVPGKGYSFSFEAQRTKVDFKAGTFPAIPQQMAEVRALCQILYEAHVDPLLNIRRAKVSLDDEESTATSDYLPQRLETNSVLEIVTAPYEVSFHALSSELASVMQGFLRSPHGFVVKSIVVDPAVEVAPTVPVGGGAPAPVPGQPPGPRRGGPGGFRGGPLPGGFGAPPPPPPPGVGSRPPGPGSSSAAATLLKERRLKVTLLVYTIRSLK